MNWIDQGFLVSKSRYSENSIIAELYTMDRGKVSGIIFGGTSKRIKNYLQMGNKLHVNYNSKNDNRMGCLLYTSPSPRDLSTSRMPSSA